MESHHAYVRAQQRGIPPLIRDWLLQFGEERYDGRGGLLRFFSARSRRELERFCGRAPVRRLAEYLNAYLVESTSDGTVITVGHNYKALRHRH